MIGLADKTMLLKEKIVFARDEMMLKARNKIGLTFHTTRFKARLLMICDSHDTVEFYQSLMKVYSLNSKGIMSIIHTGIDLKSNYINLNYMHKFQRRI